MTEQNTDRNFGREMTIKKRPYDRDFQIAVVRSEKSGRELLVEGGRRVDGTITIRFMNQTIVLDGDYQAFFPEAMAVVIRGLLESAKNKY